ncbi:MAG: MBL fold metallo-hydrolase [Crocinitomicaceae bacterium]|nr:MBL fold metallo-hydrolase [Crocinitomicaceae bacterium]
MKIVFFTFNPFQENTYLLSDDSGACVIIDPGMSNESENEELFGFIRKEKLQPKMILNTHCHIDHVLGNRACVEEYSIPLKYHALEAKVLASAPAASLIWNIPYKPSPEATVFLSEKEVVSFGAVNLEIRFTPGHAPGHIVFIDHVSKSVLSGDVLFRESIGRTDLPGSNADDLMKSILTKIYSLPDDYMVYPGHGPVTTIGWEKQHNPFVRP